MKTNGLEIGDLVALGGYSDVRGIGTVENVWKNGVVIVQPERRRIVTADGSLALAVPNGRKPAQETFNADGFYRGKLHAYVKIVQMLDGTEADALRRELADAEMERVEAEARKRNEQIDKAAAERREREADRAQAWETNKLNVAGVQRILTANGPVNILNLERKDGKIETHFYVVETAPDEWSTEAYEWAKAQSISDLPRETLWKLLIDAGFTKTKIHAAVLAETNYSNGTAPQWDRDSNAVEASTEDEALREFVYRAWKRW